MAYTLANLKTDIRGYTEVSDTVLTDSVLSTIIKNTEKLMLNTTCDTKLVVHHSVKVLLFVDANFHGLQTNYQFMGS